MKGTPNRGTAKLKASLDRVLSKAFGDPDFEDQLLMRIKTWSLDPALFRLMLAYWAGIPTKPIEHSGTVSLASIIAGTAKPDDDDPEVLDDPAEALDDAA